MNITQVKDFIKQYIQAEHFYSGSLRSSKEKSIAVINTRAYTNPIAIGSLASYTSKGIVILVHWNKNITDSESKAIEIYNFFALQKEVSINNKRVIMYKMIDPEPIYLGADDSGIYEYAIYIEIIYER